MNQVYVCSSYFHVFVSILKVIEQRLAGMRSLIIINDHIPEMVNLVPRLKEAGYFDHHLVVPLFSAKARFKKKYGVSSTIFNRNKNTISIVDSTTEITKYDEFIRSAEINIFNNRGFAYNYFLLKYPTVYIRLIEDGTGNYRKLVSNLTAFKRRYILNTVIGAGYDREVKEIQVQFPEKVDKKLRPKATLLQLTKLQNSLRNEERDKILRVFMNNVNVNFSSGRKLLLITQPLTALNESKKVKIYNEILEPYKDFTIFLKPHPRETTNYKKLLNYPFIEIPRGFPLEMFNLIDGLHFEVGLTLFSSAIDNVSCIEKKINLGKEYIDKQAPGW